jgi:hypothetical protein
MTLAEPSGCGSGSESESGSTGSTCFLTSWIRILLPLSKNSKKYQLFRDFFLTFYLWKMMWMYLQKVIFRKTCLLASWRSMMKLAGSGSGYISQMHGSADPDPDPHQNVLDPQHWLSHIILQGFFDSVWWLDCITLQVTPWSKFRIFRRRE